jgi:DNA-binding winged helix-turn-helix (wHTH) protein
MSQEALREVLKRADESAAVILNADDVASWPDGSLETLTALGLARSHSAAKVTPCPGCEERCLKRVRIVGHGDETRALIICGRHDDMEPIEIELESLRRWMVNVDRFARKLATCLDRRREAEKVEPDRLWWLGEVPVDARRAEVYLARGARREGAAHVFAESRVFRTGSLAVILTLSDGPDEPFRGTVPLLAVWRVIILDGKRLRIDTDTIASTIRSCESRGARLGPEPLSSRDVVLSVRESSHEAHLHGASLSMPVRAFKVLVLLARQASLGEEGWVTRDTIYSTLWPNSGNGSMVYVRQIDDTVRELRRSFDAVERGAGLRLIKTKSRVGYRLRLSPSDISLV